MSAEKATNPCNKFQPNIFNKTKCQNCFKSRELHLLSDRDKEQAKPIYGGWLCLAPEGTDFENPMQKSRKWQRRFFILYEHGSLSFALDELPSTLPQGTVNMNLCTDITDAEPRTGQRNALSILTPQQEIFIRGDNKEIINGWSEQLSAYLQANKQNQKKKRKVDLVTTQVTKQMSNHFLSLQPDLLNFKKGWMVKLDENDQWKKYWFVLSADSLRYYKDSVTEEASDLEGEIDLTKCYNVSEYQVQRNYGFQIHTPKAVYTLSAMTAGIRRNWIQSLMKNVHPAHAPDVASLFFNIHLNKPPDSSSTDVPSERDPHHKPRSVMERRREGRYKTFDWAEFRPQKSLTAETDNQRTKTLCSLENGDLERRRRREERRRRYESMLGFPVSWEETGDKREADGLRALSPKSLQKVEEDIEECWKQVEKTAFRLERTIPLFPEAKNTEEMEELLDSYRKRLTELERQLDQSEMTCRELQVQNMELKETEKFYLQKAVEISCQQGFASMEESHLKVVEELQRRHQQEVEHLLVERDQLLEEESAATATAIEAIKNAHRLELEREVQRRRQSENNNGNTILEELHQQHSEELASYQRELDVLSQQFCLKCLENSHLVQALDAERKALCQCQQENQDLRTRNQELSSHLAAEITRLCCLAKQDDLPLSQGMDIYEMEITLRVKESEVQSLKQEIMSLKDELQSAQRDKRNATKKYKDIYTELSIVRAQTEREMDELRENLRLAHQALDQTPPCEFVTAQSAEGKHTTSHKVHQNKCSNSCVAVWSWTICSFKILLIHINV
uniref:Myosin phosphatase Rho interacting protein n=1 Tax=Echeneis naucrates TaxID=173247 RepID=A0A665TMD6_ECHNA